MTDPIQPEELTELLDDDLEMWNAGGGTRIMSNPRPQPKPQNTPTQTPSYPPVAYTPASVPPPPVAARSNAPILAAAAGMVVVFGIAAVAAGALFFVHRAKAAESELASTTTTTTTTTVTANAEPETVTLVPTVTATAMVTATPKATATAPVVVAQPKQLGMVQTWAVGNGKPVYIDGKQVGVGGGRVKTVCGKHSVTVGTGKPRTYDIPCNGAAIVVGSPDGQ